MNRRFKLITTFATLGLALALMAFGVYAATTSSLQVTSNVSFESANVKVQYESGVVGGTFVANSAGAGVTEAAARTKSTTVAGGATDAQSKVSWNVGNYTFAANGTGNIVYTFTVTNLGSEAIKVTLTTLTIPSTNITSTVKEGATTIAQDKVWSSIANGASCSIVITLSVTDPGQSVDAEDGAISVKFSVEQA